MTIKHCFRRVQATQITTAGLAFLMVLMQGCQPRPEAEQQFETYAKRLSNVMRVPQPEFTSLSYADIAPTNTYTIAGMNLYRTPLPEVTSSPPTTNQTLSLREFQQLPDCRDLKAIIAQQNSSLGRVQSPSQRYLYQITVINLLKKCAQNTNNKDGSNQQFNQLLHIKISDLINHRHWFFKTEPAIRRSFQPSVSLLKPNWKKHQQTINAWQQLAASPHDLTQFPTNVENTKHQLNSALQQLESNPFITPLYNTLNWYTFQLMQLNQWLTMHVNQETCDTSTSQKRVEYLSNILRLFFINEIQDKGTHLTYIHYRLHPILKKIYTNSAKQAEFHQIVHNQQIIFERYQEALKSHTLIWSRLFKRCKKSEYLNNKPVKN